MLPARPRKLQKTELAADDLLHTGVADARGAGDLPDAVARPLRLPDCLLELSADGGLALNGTSELRGCSADVL